MRGLALGIVGSLALAAPPAPDAVKVVDVAAQTVRADRFPATSAAFPDRAVALPNVEYANLVGYRPLTLDLYMQATDGRAPRRPIVIWVHGGGWNRGDARTSAAFANWPAVLASLAARGYVVASINYRLSGEARFPAAIRDVRAAVRYLRANAGRYGADPDRVILWGGSAGAYLAAMASLTCRNPAYAPEPSTGRAERGRAPAASDAADCVQGVVAWYGPFDLTRYDAPQVGAMLGCEGKACAIAAKAASPVNHVLAGAAPMLLIHGTGDMTVPMAHSIAMAALMRAERNPVETLFIPGAGHGWMGDTAEATRDAHLLALDRSFAFFDANAGAGKGR